MRQKIKRCFGIYKANRATVDEDPDIPSEPRNMECNTMAKKRTRIGERGTLSPGREEPLNHHLLLFEFSKVDSHLEFDLCFRCRGLFEMSRAVEVITIRIFTSAAETEYANLEATLNIILRYVCFFRLE